MLKKILNISLLITIVLNISGCSTIEQITEVTESQHANIENSILLASNRLFEDLHENGQFVYIYYPTTQSYSNEYNIIRHILASYTLIELYKYYDESKYLEGAEKSIEFFLQYINEEEETAYITYDEETKLGAAGTAILTLLNYEETTGSTIYDNLIQKLANFIMSMQKEDGGYKNYYPEEKTDEPLSTVLYTGECNLALVRLYKKTGEAKYLTTVQKSYEWTKDYFANKHSTGLVSWSSVALAELYYITGEEKYSDLAYEMTDWLIDNTQYTEETAPEEEYIGAFLINDIEGGLTCTVAAYGEGFNTMLKLAKYMKDKEHEEKYTDTLDKAIIFLLNMQFKDEDENATGGFIASFDNDKIRLDFTSHSLITLIEYLNQIHD
ncbi:MAG: hypothetical protein ACD_65C00107G0002 [uncultured bacterium]|nr:MAG: hypothetical protein ACD_65C00107G0002 [uncultured bacterium]KKT02386.1 MAG: glycosyl transferase, group I [Candidatus Peregrinibacteria bacterium GW2011_GWF2_43_17]KKT20273.1 MAG: Poly alpha-glucosyltransferase [Candidatus Peregrinibacteria bacterium GW2011_GWA2_43_8]HAU39468.1 hypothetical protein [Candidatus Peregrinibacteria bacterium]